MDHEQHGPDGSEATGDTDGDGGPRSQVQPATEGALALAIDPGDATLDVAGVVGDVAAEHVTREQRRSRRKRAVRARTISVKRMTKRELELGRMLYPEVEG